MVFYLPAHTGEPPQKKVLFLDLAHTGETTVVFKDRSFHLRVVEDIDYLLDLVRTDDDVPFWAVLWPAAVAMAEHLWENVDFKGQSVLELGAGLGLPGVVSAAKGGLVTQTDFIPQAIALAQENGRKNGITNIRYLLADWRDFGLAEQFDWILGADILYEPKLHPFLRRIFLDNLSPGGTLVLADPGRDDARSFIAELGQTGYQITTVEREVFEAGRKVRVTLYFMNQS